MNRYYYNEFYFKPACKWMYLICLLLASLLLTAYGCRTIFYPTKPPEKRLEKMGYAVQLGAFSNFDNAANLTRYLNEKTSNAYYFIHRKGLYKVRFGNYRTREKARIEADELHKAGKISEYYIVSPHDYPVYKSDTYGKEYFRDQIVRTAESFVGIKYKYGGRAPNTGFDCSGLTMAVYQLNGLRLPRTSSQQYTYGKWVDKDDLKKGDLVFFATSGGNDVSHVGVYIGSNQFIHAPSEGKSITTESLSSRYYKERYVGAKTYYY